MPWKTQGARTAGKGRDIHAECDQTRIGFSLPAETPLGVTSSEQFRKFEFREEDEFEITVAHETKRYPGPRASGDHHAKPMPPEARQGLRLWHPSNIGASELRPH